ncbi:ABC transporter ATP-binding protein [Streptococcus chenjunshii]|uniref:ABC transporter ATP-binding protein n=1 Tax=Streptococcus chenjunshii TaxID=2173853 RepID=A0A372KNT1_9STRE|nr:ABC transporter ATP-binding protein [Streptococcus chenjunshii]AXQ79696.1 ABC transporter ATP-binding protein [Streptococcus chenjunshii]RFU51864.1 ABC transporter ATP-binding protein [Streptococcus chenjunshii]RFU53951.1 ABC transporter ATP-binding protein [Streptococcus chenjunshii]
MTNQLFKLLINFLNKPKFILGFVLSLIGTSLGILLPQLIGKLLDVKFLTEITSRPNVLAGMVLFFISAYVIRATSSYLVGTCGSQALNKIQKYIYSHLLKTSVQELDTYQSGDLASRLTNDMSIVLNFITVVVPNLLLNFIIIAGSIYFLFTISPSMTLISLFIVPVLLSIIVPINTRLETYYNNYQTGVGEISSRISHKFVHIRLMKAFRGERSEAREMGKSFDRLTSNYKKIIGWSSFQNTLISSLMMGFIILILVLAGGEVARGTMTMSSLMTFVLYLTQMIDPISDISEAMTEISEFKSVSNRLMEVLKLAKDDYREDKFSLENTAINMSGVHFAYDTDNILNNLSVQIPSGKHVAIVGPSGAGKSTIFYLLMKFYQDYQGSIQIGQQELKNLSPSQVRQMISYIPQDNTLFHGTIRENLLYGKNSSVSEERLQEILEQLDLSRVVDELEKGIDTGISDSGSGLSEGQKQRFNIARAFLVDHPIYLLDEVTANLDSVTESIISKAIDKFTAGKTRLTIAHRLNTIREADYILVLNKNGSVSDFGKHQQLLQRSGLYNHFLSELQEAS